MIGFGFFLFGVIATVSYGAIMATLLDDYRAELVNVVEVWAIGTIISVLFIAFIFLAIAGISTI
jgi:mannitol-specific phosphotransferase system IIBC component